MKGTRHQRIQHPRNRDTGWRLGARKRDTARLRRSKRSLPATGLQVAGHRYYSLELGRWASRDPLGEVHGARLYASCSNALTSAFDALGLAEKDADGHYLKLVNNDGVWEVVHEVGELTDDMLADAHKALATHMCETRNAIGAMTRGDSAIKDDLRLLPADIDGKLASLSKPGSRAQISAKMASKLTQNALLAYSAVKWFGGGYQQKFDAYTKALALYAEDPNSYSRCLEACAAGASFISSSPNVSQAVQDVCGGMWLYHCSLACCGLGGT